MEQTILNYELDNQLLDLDSTKDVTIITDAIDYTFEVDKPEHLSAEKIETDGTDKLAFENNRFILRLTGISDGTVMITLKAIAEGKAEKTVLLIIQVKIVETSINVIGLKETNEVTIGEKMNITVEHNAQNGYDIEFSNPLIIRYFNKTNNSVSFEAIGKGTTNIIFKATKNKSIEVTKEYQVTINNIENIIDDKGLPVSINLKNHRTQRIVSLITTNNESANDVTITLPEESGTLLTNEDLATSNKVIRTPKWISPIDGMTDWDQLFVSSEFELLNSAIKEEHNKTMYEVSHDKDFTEVFYTKEVEKDYQDTNEENLTQNFINGPGIGAFYYRVKYCTKNYESDWSDPVYVQTKLITKHNIKANKTNNRDFVAYKRPTSETRGRTYGNLESLYFGAYFGIVPHKSLTAHRYYRGNFRTIQKVFDKDKYFNFDTYSNKASGPLYAKQPNSQYWSIEFQKGEQVICDGKLWYTPERHYNTHIGNDTSLMKTPGTDPEWKLEDREDIGTPRLICRMVGMGIHHPTWTENEQGIETPQRWNNIENNDGFDNMGDGLSTGSNSMGKGYYKNNPEILKHGYIKYIYKGKLCYTPTKPVLEVVCYNDIMKRECHTGQRTLRLGSDLFRIRLMYEEEYTELYTRLTNGTYSNFTQDLFTLTAKTWVQDNRRGAVRTVMTGINTKEELDPRSRTGHWRFVLEWLPESEAPYRNLYKYFGKTIPLAKSDYKLIGVNNPEILRPAPNNFITKTKPIGDPESDYPVKPVKLPNGETMIYDKYTDTGYFGLVDYTDIMEGNELCAKVNFLQGTIYNPTSPYIKFYWHGLVLYYNLKPLRYGAFYASTADAANCFHGWDTQKSGVTNPGIITCNTGSQLRTTQIIAMNSHPMFYLNRTHVNNSYNFYPSNNFSYSFIYEEWGRYGMYEELICRISDRYIGYEDSRNNGHWAMDENKVISTTLRGDHFIQMAHMDFHNSANDYYINNTNYHNYTYEYSRDIGHGNSGNHAVTPSITHINYKSFGHLSYCIPYNAYNDHYQVFRFTLIHSPQGVIAKDMLKLKEGDQS